MQRKGDWIQTYTGGQFWPLDPRPHEVNIEDIAHALSMLCRFGGHSNNFYSVAEHCVHVSSVAPKHLRLIGLLHDASEAYLCDLPRPIKRDIPEYARSEFQIEIAIYKRFGIPDQHVLPYRVELKQIDLAVLTSEARQVMKPPPVKWSTDCDPADIEIMCWSPGKAKREFLKVFCALQ